MSISKNDQNGEEFDAVDHAVCMRIPQRENSLVDRKDLLELFQGDGEAFWHEFESLVKLAYAGDLLLQDEFVG